MDQTRSLWLGAMSGTSLDGVDVVAVDFSGLQPSGQWLGHHYQSFSEQLKGQLLQLSLGCEHELELSQRLAIELALIYAQAVRALLAQLGLEPSQVAAVAAHGQTVRHRPQQGFSVQLLNAAWLAEASAVAVVHEFRARDLAAGGCGAPLVPGFHQALFGGASALVVNLGGICNLSLLRSDQPVLGWDSGPGMVLLDGLIQAQLALAYDDNGAIARSGRIHSQWLERLLAEPYFQLPAPKSTGRELFNLAWLERWGPMPEATADVLATLCELTALSLCQAARSVLRPPWPPLYVCGGGACHSYLIERIGHHWGGKVATTAALGVAPQHVEAWAFAWLGRQFQLQQPGNLPEVTGARASRILGCYTPV